MHRQRVSAGYGSGQVFAALPSTVFTELADADCMPCAVEHSLQKLQQSYVTDAWAQSWSALRYTLPLDDYALRARLTGITFLACWWPVAGNLAGYVELSSVERGILTLPWAHEQRRMWTC